MSARVRFSQERPGITYVPSSRSANGDLLADILSKPMPVIHQDNRFLMDACTAASIGDEQMLKQLMRINPNTIVMKNRSGWTPLLYAAYLGHESVSAFLLDNGAKVDDSNSRGQTALMMASACGNINVVRLLLERGANTRNSDKEGRQALHYSASCSQNVVVDALLNAGCDPNAVDSQGTTAVHEAAATGHEITFLALLEKGGSLEISNAKGENASHIASACDNQKIQQIISDHHAETAKQVSPPGGRDSPRTLAELLEEMNLGRYIEQFRHENVDLEVFFELKEQDFVDMRIAYGPKKRMLDVIQRYKTTGVIRTDAFDAPQAPAAARAYGSHSGGGEDNEKVTATLRSIRDLNQETKEFAMNALECLGADASSDKIRNNLINIINNVESISLKVSAHV